MRLIPKTLFVRLVLALTLVLVAAQLISMGIHFRDRGQFLYHNLGMTSIQRISGVVRLMDSLDPEQQQSAIAALNSPSLRIQYVGQPLPELSPDHPFFRPMRAFQSRLQRNLGENRNIRIDVQSETRGRPQLDGPPRGGPDHKPRQHGMEHPMPGMMGRFPRPGPAFRVQVQLDQGAWLSFDQRLPRALFEWPRKLITSLVVLLIIAVAASWLIVRRMTRPLDRLAGAAESLGRDIRQPPLPETGSLEVQRAAAAFNQMQVRLRRFIDDRSRILSAISHDLKTPLTRLRLRTEMLDQESVQEKFEQDLNEMEQMLNSALDFMRGIENDEPVQPIDMLAMLESLQSDAQEMGQDVHLEGSIEMPYPGRPVALKRCLENLINNAVHYAGSACVLISDSATELTIRIEDDGPGIPANELSRIFDAFYRLEQSRSKEHGGSGLGLGIARNIARSHGGDLVLANRTEGGLCAKLTLPR